MDRKLPQRSSTCHERSRKPGEVHSCPQVAPQVRVLNSYSRAAFGAEPPKLCGQTWPTLGWFCPSSTDWADAQWSDPGQTWSSSTKDGKHRPEIGTKRGQARARVDPQVATHGGRI